MDNLLFATFFHFIPRLRPDINGIISNTNEYFWTSLMKERIKGNFLQLRTIHTQFVDPPKAVLHYELATGVLRESLRNLEVFDLLLIPKKNLQRLQEFKNLEELDCDFKDDHNIINIDRLIQGCSKFDHFRSTIFARNILLAEATMTMV
jgi:hypothetical protein